MDDVEWNAAMDSAVKSAKEQFQCINNSCCSAHLRMVIEKLEKK